MPLARLSRTTRSGWPSPDAALPKDSFGSALRTGSAATAAHAAPLWLIDRPFPCKDGRLSQGVFDGRTTLASAGVQGVAQVHAGRLRPPLEQEPRRTQARLRSQSNPAMGA